MKEQEQAEATNPEGELKDIRKQRAAKMVLTKTLNKTIPEVANAKRSQLAIEKSLAETFLEGSSAIVVNSPFDECENPIPPLPPLRDNEIDPKFNEFDLLSDAKLREICRLVVEDQVSAEIAGMGVGIPPATMREYLDIGRADLAAGFPSRKAILADCVAKAEYAVISESLRAVRRCPVGWQNHSFALISMFPDMFSEKRVSKKETAKAAALEALQRQLGSAMSQEGISLPKLPPSA